MATYILNEWFWADLGNETDPIKRKESIQLLTTLASNDDSIIFVTGGRAEEKFWRLCRNDSPSIQRAIGRIFVLQILRNSTKCITVHADNLPACPDHLVLKINQDDHYLIQAQLTVQASIIITTDTRLIKVLKKEDIPHEHRDKFIELYLKGDK